MGEQGKSCKVPEELIVAINAVLDPKNAVVEVKEKIPPPITRQRVTEPLLITKSLRNGLREKLLALIEKILNANQEMAYQQSGDSSIRQLMRDNDFFLQALYPRNSPEYALVSSNPEIKRKVIVVRTELLAYMNKQVVKRAEPQPKISACNSLIETKSIVPTKKKRRIEPEELAKVIARGASSTAWLEEQLAKKLPDREISKEAAAKSESEKKPELTLPEKQAQDLKAIFSHLNQFCEQNPALAASGEGMRLGKFMTNALPKPGNLLTFTNPDAIVRLLMYRRVISVSRKQINNKPIEIARVDLSVLKQQINKLENE